jgi:Flp pilus assembly pilin Flp
MWALVNDLARRARGIPNSGAQGLFKDGFKRSAHWAHPAAALFAFATDVVKPILPHCTVWVFVGALGTLAFLLVMMRLGKIAKEAGAALIAFCVMIALLSVAVIGLQRIVGGEEDGAFAKLVPGVEELQKKLGFVETKLNVISQEQRQEAARAEVRHGEEMKALSDNQKALLEALSREKGVGNVPFFVETRLTAIAR